MKSEQQKIIEKNLKKEKDERYGKIIHEKIHVSEIANIFKSLSNHYRIKILIAVYRNKDITLEQINSITGGDLKNISMHSKKLENAGLLKKKYIDRYVQHYLSADGKYFTKLILSNLSEIDW